MIKTYLFLASADGADPFALRGDDAAECLAGLCPTAVGYVQSRALDSQLDAVPTAPYCGIAELWFAEGTDALAVAGRVETLSPLWRDSSVAVAAAVTGMERIVMRRPEHHLSRAIKGVFPFRRKAGLGVAEFQRLWWLGHGPIAAETEGALAYVQCHPLPACYRHSQPSYDGITELHWPDPAHARAAMDSRQMREDQATDAQRFAEPGSVRLLLAEEEAVLPP
jgi:uncharacterized protein (TIGR02118 family)